MSRLFLLLGLLLASASSAQTVGGASVGGSALGNAGTRDVNVCLIPDTQNAISQDDFSAEPTPCGVTPGFCTGASCTASPYCSNSWAETSTILMANLAYSLTGQTSLIDYSAIRGGDNVRSGAQYPVDHPPCDLILSLGDMADVPSDDDDHGNNGLIEIADYSTLEVAWYSGQIDRVNAFLDIIKASGKPYLPLQGNHDNWSTWHAMITRLAIESESWFYSIEPTYRMSLAILVPNATGRPLCVIGVSWADVDYDTGATPTRGATVLAWLTTTWGCGGNHPTIYLQHDIASSSDSNFIAAGANYFGQMVGCSFGGCSQAGVTGTSELFMFAGGHHLSDTSQKYQYTGLFGADANAPVWGFFSNWQEANRHNVNDAGSITASDGNGTMYTVVTISPQTKQICGHDWNPYWQVRSGDGNGQVTATTITTEACFSFDFDARFPPTP